MSVKIVMMGKEDNIDSPADYEKVKAAVLDPTIAYLDIDDRLVKKSIIAEVIDTSFKMTAPSTGGNSVVDRIKRGEIK